MEQLFSQLKSGLYFFVIIIINSVGKMSCHYSCASCSAAVYMFNCISCPATRQLVDSTCVCSSGYYQAQQSSCYPSSQASYLTQAILPIATGYYYTTIALFWIYAIILFCRVNSPKIRMTLNFAQIIALLKYYPFIFDQISKQFILALSPLNFVYFQQFFTCDSTSTACKLLQYIWQPLLLLPCLLATFFLSYILMNACYKYQIGQSITVRNFWFSNWFLLVYYFIDFTAVIYGYNITKAVLYSYWGFIFVAVYFVVLVLVTVGFFRIVNSDQQGKIVYRGKYSWAFGYDQEYHLHFIDFLYTQATKVKQPAQTKLQAAKTLKLSNLLQTKQQLQNNQPQNSQPQKITIFTPHSNLYLFQLYLKIFIASSTALLYQYKPTFITIPLVILINIILIWMGVFFYYQKSSLILYILLSCVTVASVSMYWISIYWVVAICVTTLVIGIIGGAFITLFFTNKKIKGKLVKKIFQDQQQVEQFRNRSKQQLSQQQLFVRNDNNSSKSDKQKQMTIGQKSQKNTQKPFLGYVKKTKHKLQQPQQPIILSQRTNTQQYQQQAQQKDNKNEKTTKQNKKAKIIFNQSLNNQLPRQQLQQPQENVIRHSKYQNKLANIRTKNSIKNRSKNPFDDLDFSNQVKQGGNNDMGQGKQKQQVQQQQKQKQKQNQKLRSKTTINNNTKRSKQKDQDFLSNVLEQPHENQAQQIIPDKK